MNIWIGTSGFQYAEWKGNFYPEDLPAAKMLPFYAERLTTTEINYTFHRIPSPKTIDNWNKLTPEKFRFALKAPQKVTHFAKLRDCTDTLRYFHQTVSALGAKLGPVLFQLPPSFKKDATVLAGFLEEIPSGMRAAFEFRHASWFDDEVFALLKGSQRHPLRRRQREAEYASRRHGGFWLFAFTTRRLPRPLTSLVGQRWCANTPRAGTTSLFTSNTRRPASVPSWPKK